MSEAAHQLLQLLAAPESGEATAEEEEEEWNGWCRVDRRYRYKGGPGGGRGKYTWEDGHSYEGEFKVDLLLSSERCFQDGTTRPRAALPRRVHAVHLLSALPLLTLCTVSPRVA